MNNLNFRKQVPRNLLINLFSFVSTLLIGLWLTPYLLKSLGIIAYGLIPLAMFFSQYVGVILNAINMSINRFLLIHLQKKEDKEANEIFNTSLIIICVFVLLQSVVMGIIIFDLTFFFTIEKSLLDDAMWLFGLTFIGFSISLFRSIFGTPLFAYNRLDILRMIDIFQNVIRVITIITLFFYDEPSLKYIGVANLLSAISAVTPTLYYFKIYTPQLKINFSFFSRKRVSELSKMSIWILVNQVGVLLLGNIDLYLVNTLLGSRSTGEYAIIGQITSLFKTLITLVAGIISPVIMIYYANNELEKLKKIVILASKGMIIIMIIPLVITISLSEDLLNLWLGSSYKYLHTIISFSLLFYIITIAIIPLFNVTIAYNKVKLPAIIAIALGVVNIIGVYLLIKYTELGLWSIVIIKLLSEIIFSIFMVIYVSRILSMNVISLLKIPIISIIIFSINYMLIFLYKEYINMDLFSNIIILVILLVFILLPFIFLSIFSKEEKQLLMKTNKVKTFKWGLK